MSSNSFRLHAGIDVEGLRRSYAERRRIQIAPFLEDRSARLLAAHASQRTDWHLVLNSGDKVFELDDAAQRALTGDKRRALDIAVAEAARFSFQYRFETIRVPDEVAARSRADTLLERFAAFMSGEEVLDLLRNITGATDLNWADVQATRYRSGHFLTEHDDLVEGKTRHAAYVLGLSPSWRTDWGGLLMFHQDEGIEGFVPRFNALSLFAVPQRHSVSYVNPSAGASRVSVTGWLRGGPVP